MRKNRKILLSIILIGTLISGIGLGVAFSEFSKVTYGGKFEVDSDFIKTETFEIKIDNSDSFIELTIPYYTIEEDENIPKDKIYVDVTYNSFWGNKPIYLSSYNYSNWYMYDENTYKKQFLYDNRYEYNEALENIDVGFQISDGSTIVSKDITNVAPGEEAVFVTDSNKKIIKENITDIELTYTYSNSGVEKFIKIKDEIIKDLKNRQLRDYSMNFIEKCVVKINPDTMKRVR